MGSLQPQQTCAAIDSFTELLPLMAVLLRTRLRPTEFSQISTLTFIPQSTPRLWQRLPTPLNSSIHSRIDDGTAKKLGTFISSQEAIRLTQNGKSPGPDSFTVVFYKAYSTLFIPIIVRMYSDSFRDG